VKLLDEGLDLSLFPCNINERQLHISVGLLLANLWGLSASSTLSALDMFKPQVGSELPPYKAPVMIAEQRNLFVSFLSPVAAFLLVCFRGALPASTSVLEIFFV